jgi:hypothetical protein
VSASIDDLAQIHPRAPDIVPLAKNGVTWRRIAEQLGMTEGGVYDVVRRLRKLGILDVRAPLKARGPAKPVVAKVSNAGPIRCLCCRSTFQSKDRVRNRICVPCKGTGAW